MARNKKCIICWKEHSNTMSKTCSPFCSRKHQANLNKANKEKVRLKKEKVKEKKQNSISYLTKCADTLWSECVKINYNYACQYCGKTEWLNSHHLFTRSRKATRFDIDNGICLCVLHHTLSHEFSAHQTWNEFFLWLESIKWRQFIDDMSQKSQQIVKVTPEYILACIKELEDFKNKNLWN